MNKQATLVEPHISTEAHTHNREPRHHDAVGHRPVGDGECRPAGGPLLLDIGGNVGAVIARLDDALEGTELAILALDDPDWDPTTHTGVWRRSIGGGSVVVAVYPTLESGRYRITLPNGRTADLAVVGSYVTNVDLRSAEKQGDA